MDCPKCNVGMEAASFGGIDVDRCTQCKGLWFDAGEVDALKEIPGSEALDGASGSSTSEAGAGPVECPRCRTHMIRMSVPRQPHIQYASCTVCFGSFFDAGEFTDLKELTVVEWLKSLAPGR